MKKYIIGENCGFYIEVPKYENHYVNFIVYEITGFQDKNNFSKELYCEITVKWDGCSHFYFGEKDEDGYLHICGVHAYIKHISLMRWIYDKALELMNQEPYCNQNWPKNRELNWEFEERELDI